MLSVFLYYRRDGEGLLRQARTLKPHGVLIRKRRRMVRGSEIKPLDFNTFNLIGLGIKALLYREVHAGDIFIAQAYGVDLSLIQQLIIIVTALLASIGAAAIPMAGLVMITVILTAVGLPLEGVGLILAVDRILDMFRTATNVWSDSCGAVIIAKSDGEKLNV